MTGYSCHRRPTPPVSREAALSRLGTCQHLDLRFPTSRALRCKCLCGYTSPYTPPPSGSVTATRWTKTQGLSGSHNRNLFSLREVGDSGVAGWVLPRPLCWVVGVVSPRVLPRPFLCPHTSLVCLGRATSPTGLGLHQQLVLPPSPVHRPSPRTVPFCCPGVRACTLEFGESQFSPP